MGSIQDFILSIFTINKITSGKIKALIFATGNTQAAATQSGGFISEPHCFGVGREVLSSM
jgi:hypothetical protein